MRRNWILLAPLAMTAMLAFVALGGWVVMLLWNWLMPSLFRWPALTFWQALGLLVLCRILFVGLGGPQGAIGSSIRRRMREHRERWELLTPEERERLRQRMRERWGFGPAT